MAHSWTSKSEETVEEGTEEFYEVLSWIKASPKKQDALKLINDRPVNTRDLADRWEVKYDTARYHLEALLGKGECPAAIEDLTPPEHKHTLYGLTELGETIVGYL